MYTNFEEYIPGMSQSEWRMNNQWRVNWGVTSIQNVSSVGDGSLNCLQETWGKHS